MPNKLSYQELEQRVLRLENESIHYLRIQKVLETRLELMEFAQSHSIDEILRQTLDEVEKSTDSIVSFYHFVEPDQKTLSIQMWSTGTVSRFCRAEGGKSHYSIDKAGVWVDCIHHRQAVIHNDYNSLKHKKGLPEGHAPITRELVVPIFRNDCIVAILGVGNKEQDYDDGDVEVVTKLADLAWDIVERKQEEAKRHRNEKILKVTQNISNIGGWQWNTENEDMFWTDKTYHIHGIDPASITPGSTAHISKSLECYHPKDRKIILQAFETCKNEGVPYDLTFPFTAFDGTQKWIRTTAQAVVKDGNIREITGNICDITDHKQVEEKERASKAYLDKILNNIGDPVFVKDDQHRMTLVNNAFCSILGLTKGEIIGKTLAENLPPDEMEHFLKIDRQILADGQENLCEESLTAKGGKKLAIVTRKTCYVDENGNKFIIGVIRDITERKMVEDSLAESEKRFKALHDASFGGVIIHEQGLILDCNQELSNMTGFSNEELVGMDGFKLIEPDSLDLVLKNIKRGYDQGYEVEGLRKDGSVYPLAIRGKSVHYKDREVRVIEFRDITRRKTAERALQKSEERFRELADLLPQTVFEVDLQGDLKYANQMGFESTGYSPEDIEEGLNVNQIIVPNDRSKLVKNIARIIEERIDSNNEYMFLRKDGTIFPGIIYSRPIIQNDEVVGLRGTVVDISNRKRIEQEKEELESHLRQAYKMEAIGTMAGGIAHDFNNMLAIIIGNADMALDDVPENNPGRQNIQQIIQASQRVKDLVKQILIFSRQADQKLLPIKLCSIIKDSLKLLRSTTPTTVSIVQDFSDECGIIMADITQINQLLMNLCSNAIYAMDEKGTLEVNGKMVDLEVSDTIYQPGMKPGRYFKLSVSDTGIGIAEENKERIFDPFYTTKDVNEGTGMGLSIVLGIVKSHNGFIQADSKPGEGTVFTLFFPIIENTQPLEKEVVSDESPQGDQRILFVDDEEMLAVMGGRMLERLGYHVTVKSSSNEALETFKSSPEAFDLVITDQSMPNMSGAELAVGLLEIRPDIPIILCTGYSKKISKEEAKRLGIRKYLQKPLDRKQLAKFVREVLD